MKSITVATIAGGLIAASVPFQCVDMGGGALTWTRRPTRPDDR